MNEKLLNTDYLYHLCQKFDLRPSRKYGQNFLIDPEPIEAMIDAGDVKKKDVIVEIGPGFGILTFALAEKAGRVLAFEIEKKLEQYWVDNKPENLQIFWGNVLRVAPASDSPIKDLKKYKVVANLPYQITSNAIRTFLELPNQPEEMILMIQREVAERICAKPGDMSLLSVAVQYYAEVEIVCNVPRKLFWPEPAVDSAVLKIIPKKGVKNDEAFFNLVRVGFAQRRKLLIKNLLPAVGKENKVKLGDILLKLGYNENVRAQELSIEAWKKVSNSFS